MYINNDIDYLKYLKDKKIVIWGAGQNGKIGFSKINGKLSNVIAFCDNDERKQRELFCGLKVIYPG